METNRNTKILKNSFWLYLRMILNMGIALFSSRVLLNALGVENFGILNWLTTLITMFLFFTAAVSDTLQRFLNILIEQKNIEKAQIVFSMVVIFTVTATAVVMIGESFFCEWILTHKLKIAAETLPSARFLFYCLLIAIFFQTSMLPWQEAILAKEKMGFYAILCLSCSALKLILALLVQFFICTKKLEFYGIGFILINLFFWLAAAVYCRKEIPESRFRWVWDRDIRKEIQTFFSYTFGAGLVLNLSGQGVVVLLGIFFGPAVNAAYAIANQVRLAVSTLPGNLAMAIKPQLVQSYTAGEMEYVRSLFFSSCKFCYYALLFVITPILVELPYILKLWLKTVPEYTAVFTCILILYAMFNSFSTVFILIKMATGKCKAWEIIGRTFTVLSLIVAYVVLKLGGAPWSAILIFVLGEFATSCYWLWNIKTQQIQISILLFLKDIVGVVLLCTILSWGILFALKSILLPEGFLRFMILSFLSLPVNAGICFFLGTNRTEKKMFFSVLNSYKESMLKMKVKRNAA